MAFRVFLEHYGLVLFESSTAAEWYSLSAVCTDARAWFEQAKRTHASFARVCPHWDATDARWRGHAEWLLQRLPFVERTVTSWNLRGCVSPGTLAAVASRLETRACKTVLLGALPGDFSLLFGLQLPALCVEYAPRPHRWLFSEEDGRLRWPAHQFAGCWTESNVLRLPRWKADAASRELRVEFGLLNANETSSFYAEHTYELPPALAYPQLEVLVVHNLLPDDFCAVAKALAGLHWLHACIAANPGLVRIGLVQRDQSCVRAVTMEPLSDAELRGGSHDFRTAFGGDVGAHRRLVAAWNVVLAWGAQEGCTLSMLFTDAYHDSCGTARYAEYTGGGWVSQGAAWRRAAG